MALFVVTISMYILSVVAVHWLIFLKLKNQTAFCQVQSLSKNTYTYSIQMAFDRQMKSLFAKT